MILMTKSELNSIEERYKKIPSEKWEMHKVVVGNVAFYDVVTDGESGRPHTKQDCEFIVNARTDIHKLLQHINNLQTLLKRNGHLGLED